MMEPAERSLLATDVLPAPTRSPRTGDAHDSSTGPAALAGHDRVVAIVGDELRRALGPVQALHDQFAAVVDDPRTFPMVASRAAMLTRNLRRFAAAIDGVADVADLRCGRLQLAPTTVDLAEVAREVCRDLAGEAAGRAELVLDAVPAMGWWDRARLGRLVGHVVSNAIRHAGGRIEISVLARDREAELVVRDRGPGLDPAKLSRWFDRAEPLRRPDSFGIGLWIIKTLSEAMRGSVTAANCCDGGARFCIVLPRG